ncbi:MAG: hypothetical protein NXI04_07165 [Planctomycetaceae bacterium]|nr:hypothetical protein [Planctomycetaceae bacterium]
MPSDRRYTEAYSQMANSIQTDAETKLGRPMSAAEADAIRNAGSLMMLESVGLGIERASGADDVIRQITDATLAFADRLDDARNQVQQALCGKLNRSLSLAETQAVAGISNCLTAMQILHNIDDAVAVTSVSDVMV